MATTRTPHRTRRVVHALAIMMFGIVVPVALMIQAYASLSHLGSNVAQNVSTSRAATVFEQIQPKLKGPNDYALFAVLYSEHTNQAVVTNKQIMKTVIMQIGFAVVSLGLMLVILGINDGGADATSGFGDLKFDFKTGSTGVLVFVIGAAMATAGGVLKNDYTTVNIPSFTASGGDTLQLALVDQLNLCRETAGDDYPACFTTAFENFITGDAS